MLWELSDHENRRTTQQRALNRFGLKRRNGNPVIPLSNIKADTLSGLSFYETARSIRSERPMSKLIASRMRLFI